MLKHLNKNKKIPKRVLILGSNGFVSSSVQKRLINLKIKVIGLTRKKIDLSQKKSQEILSKIINHNDTILFVAAKAPVKNEKMLIKNLQIALNICEVIKNKKIKHFIYLSSDAVYADSKKKLNENSKTIPESLHGIMHLTREIMLSQIKNLPLCIVRPTLIFGANDPHNGYGPNRFVKLGVNKKNIVLFGNGEEKRDHVHVNDVVSVIMFCIFKRANGVLNIASGKVNSFLKIAELVNKLTKNKKKIQRIKRAGPMPHNGYRPFKVNLLKNNFKKLKVTNIKQGIKSYIPQI